MKAVNNPYEELANAIVFQAVKDYRAAKQKLKKKPRDVAAKAMKEECERFSIPGGLGC